jgi:predicted PhzF superfamily epimerase YddE/YHI9
MESLSFEQGYVLNSPSTIQARLSLQATQILRVEVGGTACLTGQVELLFNSGQLQQGSVKQIVTS